MSFKRFLKNLSEDELRQELTDLHRRLPQVREFYTLELTDDREKIIAKYHKRMEAAFFRGSGKRGRSQTSQIIRDFRAVSDSTTEYIGLLFYRAELMARYAADKHISSPTFYKSVEKAFRTACETAREEVLLEHFRSGARAQVERFGWHNWLTSILHPSYTEYFGDDPFADQ